MSEFAVGIKVVCVDDGEHPEWPGYDPSDRSVSYWITKGNTYVIRGFRYGLLQLNGINRARFENDTEWADGGFSPLRFRPIESKSIQLFRDIASGITPLIPDDQLDEVEQREIAAMFESGGGPVW